jgi:hypothetical protein
VPVSSYYGRGTARERKGQEVEKMDERKRNQDDEDDDDTGNRDEENKQ